jgi:hypothetical protein
MWARLWRVGAQKEVALRGDIAAELGREAGWVLDEGRQAGDEAGGEGSEEEDVEEEEEEELSDHHALHLAVAHVGLEGRREVEHVGQKHEGQREYERGHGALDERADQVDLEQRLDPLHVLLERGHGEHGRDEPDRQRPDDEHAGVEQVADVLAQLALGVADTSVPPENVGGARRLEDLEPEQGRFDY